MSGAQAFLARVVEALDAFLAALESEDLYFDVDVARDEFRRRGQFNVI